MNAQHYTPSAWLQLSQLHTLRGVDLHDVSMAAIAAALPRLHTLFVFALQSRVSSAAVAGFSEVLLRRLQAFQYVGPWPQNLDSDDAADATSSCTPLPRQLPNLRTLNLQGFGEHAPPWAWFMGAQPLELYTDDGMIRRWLPPEDAVARPTGAACSPLVSVRRLVIIPWSPTAFTPSDGARLLRAAPHLETLTVAAASPVDFEPSWLAHPAFDGLAHLKLRYVCIYGFKLPRPLPSDFVPRLRQRHFPRLKEVAIGGCHYYVTPLEPPAAKSFFQRVVKVVAELVSRF
jgi:hypothetical protein